MTDDGVASVEMPGKPEASIETTETEKGPLERHRVGLSLKGRDQFFSMQHFNFPDPNLTDEERFEGAKTLANLAGGVLIESKRITLDGVPGIELRNEVKGYSQQIRLFVLDGRGYQVQAVVKKEEEDSETVKRFLNSFKFVKPGS